MIVKVSDERPKREGFVDRLKPFFYRRKGGTGATSKAKIWGLKDIG